MPAHLAADPALRTVFLHTEPCVTAVFARHRGCVRALYYTAQRAELAAQWASFLREKNERVEEISAEAMLRLHPGAVEGLLVETERPAPKSPGYSEILRDQREGRPLLFVDGVPESALGELAARAVPAGFCDWILSERQSSPAEAAFARAAGALESVRFRRTSSLRRFLKDMRAHFLTVGLARSGGRPLDKLKPPRAPGRPVALIWSAPQAGAYPCELAVRFDGTEASADLLFRILQASHNVLE